MKVRLRTSFARDLKAISDDAIGTFRDAGSPYTNVGKAVPTPHCFTAYTRTLAAYSLTS